MKNFAFSLGSLFFLFELVFSQAYIVPDLERDDFDGSTLKSWWSNAVTPSSGANHVLTVLNGYIKAELIDPLNGDPGGRLDASGSGMENIGIVTSGNQRIYGKNMAIDVTIRVKTLNAMEVGSRGWGFWRAEKVPIVYNQAVWYFEQLAHPDSSWATSETYWRAQTMDGIQPSFQFETDITENNQTWHVYKIRRYSGSVSSGYYEHYVDGVLKQRVVPSDFPDGTIINDDYSFQAWNDNLVYHHTTTSSGQDTIEVFYNGWLGASRFIIDFVEITKDGYDPSYNVSPVDASDFLRLRAYESEIDDGVSDGLWKTYDFTTSSGNVFVIITAKAETYDGYDGDDDLKLVVDGTTDYGFDNSNSWNGDVDDALPKTLVFTPSLSSGSHTIQIYSNTTPILYDVNVLNSANGALVLDQTLNETAPSGSSNLLWKQFTFSCNSGPVAVYVSASADEEPGWNHQDASIDSTDDDELRIVLDNTDFGWGGSYGFEGNSIYGDVKTVLIKDTLSAGSHTLKFYVNESPTVYRVLVFAENGDYTLPVSFTQVTAQKENSGVRLFWRTESEIDNSGFNIYRAESADSVQPAASGFERINNSLIPAAGSSSMGANYTFVDQQKIAAPFAFYKIEAVGLDGASQFSKTVRLASAADWTPVPEQRTFYHFPDPFNPKVTIRFKIQEKQNVGLTIFDRRGRKIKQLWSGSLNAGEHQFQWDGRDENGTLQSSGVYFYRIKTEKRLFTGKMTFLK